MTQMARLVVVGVCWAATMRVAAGCATASAPDRTGIDLSSGRVSFASDILSVVLDENVTTGYEWTYEVEGDAVQPTNDEPLSAEDLGEKGEEPLVGAPAAHLFEFAPKGSGEATITLRYERSWEDAKPAKTVVIRTTVEDGAFATVEAEEQEA